MPEQPAVIATELSKDYGRHRALADFDVELERGEALGLIGANGAGKTTLLHLVVGEHRPTRGTILVFGRCASDTQARVRIGFAPQMLALYPDLTARENVEFFARLCGVRRDQLERATARALELTELSSRSRARTDSLSGGMQRRLNLACAIAHRPDLLVLDEPTAGVDAASRRQISCTLSALHGEGASIMLATHLLTEVVELCDRVAVLDRGRLVALKSPRQLEREHGSLEAAACRLKAPEADA
jgi:ABC-2 type transport system ATP-binding protein